MKNYDKYNYDFLTYITLIITVIIITILSISMGFPVKVSAAQEKKTDFRKYWPSPNNAKIKFIRSISHAQQLKPKQEESLWGKIVDFLLGQEESKARLERPFGLSSFNNELYIADPTAQAVYKIDFNEHKMKKILYKSEGSFFSGEGKKYFETPIDVVVDGKKIFVSDSSQQEVLVFSNKGKLIKRLGVKKFKRPTGLGIDRKQNRLYIVDTIESRVYIYDTNTYKLIKSFGQRGVKAGRFNYPIDISVKNEKVYVSDSMNFRVQIFDLKGNFISKFGDLGDSSGRFARPKGLAVDSDGHIYVVDTLFGVVQIFNEQGQLLLILGEKGTDLGEFWLPTGIYIDQQNKIYVADSHNHRIQIFKYLGKQ
ncbi:MULTISPECIES: 6-bladed beta-propeller [unclassified Candidatus Frackibacter]|uniref:6-bladed beta-propeller n=1 Tax=unclassified Candidatus Frackibacter TaxID=2648818 RepID=UPI00088A6B3D|nr:MULTISPECIES: 6-bladed beta-propeller [unclassified Candidatus Frackibacter]SDC46978.1 NHL repeat-containing protein [Candidatus Frackibacter sp. WG11]SEM81615.1 NHL repeat-containing protein [Candidatus Frackibacter sp. WG12]SFL72400.1 NHL repeat-containing protein [Candidatus Frackibacter sp. WG13]